MESILEGLKDIQKNKIGNCISTKELWLKLEQHYSNKEEEVEVMELMLEYLTDLQKEKIGKYNSIEELLFKINQLNLDEKQEAEDIPMKRSVQDPGKFEGKSHEHSVCNAFKEICLLGIGDKSYSEFIECDENHYSISDSSLADTKVEIVAILDKVELENEITNDTVESIRRNVMNILEEAGNLQAQNLALQDQLDKFEQVKEEEYDKATNTIMDLKLQVKEAIRIKEETSSSLKDELEKLAT